MRINTLLVCATLLCSFPILAHEEETLKSTSEILHSEDILSSIKTEDLYSSRNKIQAADLELNANDFVGKFVWKGRNQLKNVNRPNGGCLSIIQDPENAESLLISGFDYYGLLKGYVKDNRLYIPNQIVAYHETAEADIWFWNVTARNSQEGEDPGYYFNLTPETEFYFSLTEDNHLVAGSLDLDDKVFDNYEYTDKELSELICIASDFLPDIDTWTWSCHKIEGIPLEDYFTFNDSEWTYIGESNFKDAWFQTFWQDWEGDSMPIYLVPTYRNLYDENRFLLKNPYGANTPMGKNGYNLSKKEGYIIFNISDPDCVMIEPYIFACTIPSWGDITDKSVDMYVDNSEGYYYYRWGNSLEEIYQKNLNLSTFNEEYARINIRNAGYARSDGWEILSGRYTTSSTRTGYIEMPADYNNIDTVVQDYSDCPKEYYNLQGVRIANPEKGQLIIVRQGDKTTKQIMR